MFYLLKGIEIKSYFFRYLLSGAAQNRSLYKVIVGLSCIQMFYLVKDIEINSYFLDIC
jgi:hypothetical protein